MSVGELAITPKISLVAVCCSSDFLELLEQPDILDGDHRLGGKGSNNLIWLSVNGRTSMRRMPNQRQRTTPSRSNGVASRVR